MKSGLLCIAILLPVFAWADEEGNFFTLSGTPVITMPAKDAVITGSVGFWIRGVSADVFYRRNLGVDNNMLGVDVGYCIGSTFFVRPSLMPAVVFGGDRWKFEPPGVSAETGIMLEFLNWEGRERLSIRVEYLPDSSDDLNDGHFADMSAGLKFQMDFPF